MFDEWLHHLGLCPIRNITGLPCPGCGMTRAFLAVARFDFARAFEFHPLFWLIPLIFLIYLLRNKVPLFMRLVKNKAVTWSLVGLFIITYSWRMIQLFPSTAPMTFNSYGFLPLLWQAIIN